MWETCGRRSSPCGPGTPRKRWSASSLSPRNELNGIARVTVIRSDTLFGLSNIRVVFADGTDDYWARQQAQERINQAQIPADAKPSLGPLSSVIGEVPLHPRVQEHVAGRAQEPPGLGTGARVPAGAGGGRRGPWGGGTKQYEIIVDPGRFAPTTSP